MRNFWLSAFLFGTLFACQNPGQKDGPQPLPSFDGGTMLAPVAVQAQYVPPEGFTKWIAPLQSMETAPLMAMAARSLEQVFGTKDPNSIWNAIRYADQTNHCAPGSMPSREPGGDTCWISDPCPHIESPNTLVSGGIMVSLEAASGCNSYNSICIDEPIPNGQAAALGFGPSGLMPGDTHGAARVQGNVFVWGSGAQDELMQYDTMSIHWVSLCGGDRSTFDSQTFEVMIHPYFHHGNDLYIGPVHAGVMTASEMLWKGTAFDLPHDPTLDYFGFVMSAYPLSSPAPTNVQFMFVDALITMKDNQAKIGPTHLCFQASDRVATNCAPTP